MKNFTHNKHTYIHSVFIFCAVLLINSVFAQDKHIDPSANFDVHKISFSRHLNTTFTSAQVDDLLKFGSSKLQSCDNVVTDDQDVATKVNFIQLGTFSTFGSASDGLDVITNSTDEATVQAEPGFVKIVTSIVLNGRIVTGKVPKLKSKSLILAATSNSLVRADTAIGQTFIHEFGHNQGLMHRGLPGAPPLIGSPFMAPSAGAFYEVNLDECIAYHNGYNVGTAINKNRPVDLEFTIDDTGSMTEEIDGVKQAIIDVLSSSAFSESSCGTTFQLSTFKDDVTVRAPSTDLNVIKNQVSALFASGGNDCPEGSAEAVDAIKDYVKDNANIYIATDAAPHAGYDITASTASLKARGVKVNILLSGDCYSTSFKTTDGSDKPPYSDNKGKANTIAPSAALSGDLTTAIEAFSYMAKETGGIFTYIPEVNFGTANDKQRYQNTWYNMILSSILPTITLADPAKGPVGGTVALTIRGTNTHFNNTTSVSFADSKITVKSVKVFGATSVQAIIAIDPSATLGLKDIVASTRISDTGYEIINGVGLFEVTTAPSTPTILSVSPSSGGQNEKLTVTITGINTHFTNASVLNMGTGISILKVNAKSGNLLEADIKIDSVASVGFRSITVTTGSELAFENVTGPFLVVESSCDLTGLTAGPDKTVYPDTKDSACTILTVTGITGDIADYKFFWNTGETTPSIKVCPAADTTYTVIVTRGECTFSDDVTVSVKYATTITCPGNKVVQGSGKSCTAIVQNIDPVLPAGNTSTVMYNLSGATTGSGSGSVSGFTFKKGITMVTYSIAGDASQNCSFKVEVKSCTSGDMPTLSITDTKVSESNYVSFIAVKLSQPVNKIVRVKYTTIDKTAKHGSDYVKVSGTLYFIPKINQVAFIAVPILKDDIAEGDEMFEIKLSNPVNADIADSIGVVTISEDKSLITEENLNSTDDLLHTFGSCNTLDNIALTDFNNALSRNHWKYDRELANPFKVIVYPNPSSKSFTIQLSGNDLKSKSSVVVYDAMGKAVEVKEGILANQSFKIGEKLNPGTYFIYASSGKDKAQSIIIKLAE